MKIGILALQGAFIEHKKMFDDLNVQTFEIRQLKDINQDFDAIVLPGGESSTQIRLLKKLKLFEPLKEKIENGLYVMATCAGLILLSQNIKNQSDAAFKTLPISVVRNAYGRQLNSFVTNEEIIGIGKMDMIFIRAPHIEKVDDCVEVLSKVNDKIVAIKYKNQLAFSFHPELSKDNSIHKYFISMINN